MVVSARWPTTATRPRPASASPSGARPTSSTSPRPRGEAAERATRMLGATKPAAAAAHRGARPVRHGAVPGVLSATLNGEAVLKGRSLFANRIGEEVASPLVTLVDDPTNPLAFIGAPSRRRGPGHAAQRADRRRRAAGLRAVVATAGAAAAPPPPATPSRRLQVARPACGCLALPAGARAPAPQADAHRRHRRRRADPGGRRAALGREPRVAATSRPARPGSSIADGALGGPVREFTIASTIQRMLKDVVEVGGDVDWLPMRAAGVSLVVHDVTISGA